VLPLVLSTSHLHSFTGDEEKEEKREGAEDEERG
jgi:hypothetical protein